MSASPAAHVTTTIAPEAFCGSVLPLGRGTAESTNNLDTDASTPTLEGTVMIVDDEISNVLIVKKHLQNAGYRSFETTTDPSAAIAMMVERQPDVLLLDINMPQIGGIDILRSIRAIDALSDLPVLILTANTDQKIKWSCLELGATDFLVKPVCPLDLTPRVRNAIHLKRVADQLRRHSADLEVEVTRRTEQLHRASRNAIYCLARAAELRDNDTGNHVIRVGRYAGIIAAQLGLSESFVDDIIIAAQLHDVGKIAIADEILLKPGKLEPEEYEIIQRHVQFGHRIIEPHVGREAEVLRQHVVDGNAMLTIHDPDHSEGGLMQLAASIAQTHHEKFDGSGYPLGLAGEDIPIEGRITAVADVFDALSSTRPYKKPMPRQKCFDILEEGRGGHFDPQCLDAFFAATDEIIAVQRQYMD